MVALVKGKQVTRQALADVFGVSLPTIDAWVRKGCPFVEKGGRGQEWQFNTAQVSKWLRDRDVEEATGDIPDDMDELKLRNKKQKLNLLNWSLLKKG